MKIRRHNNKGGQPPMVITGTGIKSGSITPTFEMIQSGSGQPGGASGAVLVNYIWATLINK